MTLDRRSFVTGAVAAGTAAASSLPKPAIAQNRIEWSMVTSWPKGLPGLGTGAERVARRIEALSDERIKIKVYAGDEIVPALQVFDAVSRGTAQIGHDAAYYHTGKTRAAAFFTAVPFGMTANELAGWIHWGGGQELWDRAYEPFDIKPFLCGNTGTQMGGWYKKEINEPSDFNDLKIRMPGQGGEVVSKLGATVVLLSGKQIFQNLQTGAIDAAEWVGPYNDLALNFYQVAKYYYYPGFHEPGAGLECLINKGAYEDLPEDLKEIVRVAAEAENDIMWAEYQAKSANALRILVEQHGVQLRQYPRAVLKALGDASGQLVRDLMEDEDPITAETARAFVTARADAMRFSRISEQAMLNSRLLRFDYPR